MAIHKNHRRSEMIIDRVNLTSKRKLGRIQAGVLRALLEMGTYPGTWQWSNTSTTTKTLDGLYKRGLVDVQVVEGTDWRGNPGQGRVKFYRPKKWMLDAMNATEFNAEEFLAR